VKIESSPPKRTVINFRKEAKDKKSKTPLNQSAFQRLVRAVWCDIFSHPMRFDSSNAAGPSTCILCGYKEPGIKWERGPSTELFSEELFSAKMKNLNTGKIMRETVIRDSKSRNKTYEEVKP